VVTSSDACCSAMWNRCVVPAAIESTTGCHVCREADDGSVAVAGARLVPAESYAAAISLFQRGSRSRTVGAGFLSYCRQPLL